MSLAGIAWKHFKHSKCEQETERRDWRQDSWLVRVVSFFQHFLKLVPKALEPERASFDTWMSYWLTHLSYSTTFRPILERSRHLTKESVTSQLHDSYEDAISSWNGISALLWPLSKDEGQPWATPTPTIGLLRPKSLTSRLTIRSAPVSPSQVQLTRSFARPRGFKWSNGIWFLTNLPRFQYYLIYI